MSSITKTEWEEFQHFFLMALFKEPTRKMGSMFIAWFPDVADYLRENSHLGGNPGHAASMDEILRRMDSNVEAKLFIQEFVEIVNDELPATV